jgi:exosortase/archaeosortase family protein
MGTSRSQLCQYRLHFSLVAIICLGLAEDYYSSITLVLKIGQSLLRLKSLENLSMQSGPKKNERYASFLKKSLPILSFVGPFIILYFLAPSVFEKTWKGRLFYMFFLWLVSLELVLGWEKLRAKLTRVKSVRTIALILAVLMPTIYVVVANFYGLITIRSETLSDVTFLPPEYFVFAVLFTLIILLEFGTNGLKNFPISASFLGVIGIIYAIDNVCSSSFSPFQIIVPTTATLAAKVLGLIGYHTAWGPTQNGMPTLIAWGPQGSFGASIAWPCSGVDSLLIYTVTILLFLRNSDFSWKQRAAYFILGAIVTYFINVLRIVTIFVIGINHGDWMAFHDIYGSLYSITWIVSYPLLIIGSQMLLAKMRNRRRT